MLHCHATAIPVGQGCHAKQVPCGGSLLSMMRDVRVRNMFLLTPSQDNSFKVNLGPRVDGIKPPLPQARAPHAFVLPFYDTNIGHWMKQHGSMNPLQSYAARFQKLLLWQLLWLLPSRVATVKGFSGHGFMPQDPNTVCTKPAGQHISGNETAVMRQRPKQQQAFHARDFV